MKRALIAASAISLGIALAAGPALAVDESDLMSKCNTFAAKKLGLSTSDIASVKYEGQRTDGTYAVNGETTSGQTFQCSFNSAGTHVQAWTHSKDKSCPIDVSEADRSKYPACN